MLAAAVASLVQWKRLSKPDRLIAMLLVLSVFAEVAAYCFMVYVKNNMYVYHLFSPFELGIIAFYYNEAVPFLKRRRIGILVTLAGFGFAAINSGFFQPLSSFPSLFLLFEGFLIVLMSLLSFFSILYKEDYVLRTNAQFLISFNLLVFWSFTFLLWGTYVSFSNGLADKLPVIYHMLTAINFVCYVSYFLIFTNYSKLIRSGE